MRWKAASQKDLLNERTTTNTESLLKEKNRFDFGRAFRQQAAVGLFAVPYALRAASIPALRLERLRRGYNP